MREHRNKIDEYGSTGKVSVPVFHDHLGLITGDNDSVVSAVVSMVKPVRESELAIRPNCEGSTTTLGCCSQQGRAPWPEMNTHQGMARLGW